MLIVSYAVSFYLLAVLSQRLPLAVIYASWSGLGVVSVALFSVIFYKQILNWQMILGIFFIIIGVTLVNIYKVES